MTMKTVVKPLAKILTFTLLIQFCACWAADSQALKIAALVSNAAQKIGGAKKMGVGNVTMNWSGNPEVKEISAFGFDKRMATLMKIVDYLATNEERIFPDIKTNGNQQVAATITRIISLTHLSALISSADNDVVVKDYLDGEMADLKMVLNGKYNLGYGIYRQARKMRDDKRVMLLYQDEKIVHEMLILMEKEDNIAQTLANKTIMISLIEACDRNPDLCAKL